MGDFIGFMQDCCLDLWVGLFVMDLFVYINDLLKVGWNPQSGSAAKAQLPRRKHTQNHKGCVWACLGSWILKPQPSRATPQCRVLIWNLIFFLIHFYIFWDIDHVEPKNIALFERLILPYLKPKYCLIWNPNIALFVNHIFHCWLQISIFHRCLGANWIQIFRYSNLIFGDHQIHEQGSYSTLGDRLDPDVFPFYLLVVINLIDMFHIPHFFG